MTREKIQERIAKEEAVLEKIQGQISTLESKAKAKTSVIDKLKKEAQICEFTEAEDVFVAQGISLKDVVAAVKEGNITVAMLNNKFSQSS